MVLEFLLAWDRKKVKAAVAVAMIGMWEMITKNIGYNGELLAAVRLWNRLFGDLQVRARWRRGRWWWR